MALDLTQVWENGSTKFCDFLAVLSRTQNETHRFFIFLDLYFVIVLFEHSKNLSILCPRLWKHNFETSWVWYQNEAYGHSFFAVFLVFFEKMDGLRLITYLVKFLPKLSKIEGDKNFLKRGEVDVIKFRPLIKILLILMAQ